MYSFVKKPEYRRTTDNDSDSIDADRKAEDWELFKSNAVDVVPS